MSHKKPNLLLFILPLVVFIAILVLLALRLNKADNGAASAGIANNKSNQVAISAVVNKPVPDFALTSLYDEKVGLLPSHLPKEPYILNVWGTWCIACAREHPILIKQKEKGVNIVGINYKDEREYAKKYLAEEGDPYSMNVYDEEGDLGIDLGLTGAPETFVVDANGIIRQHIIGEITADNWQSRIHPCLTAVKEGKTVDELGQVCH